MLLGNRRAWNDTPLAVPARVPCLGFVSSRAEGGASASGFDLAAPAPAMGILRREPIETAGRGVAASTILSAFPRVRARAAPRPAVSMRATRSYGVGFGASRSKPLAEGLSGVCALWHFRRGDWALDPWACGAERRAANEGKQGDC